MANAQMLRVGEQTPDPIRWPGPRGCPSTRAFRLAVQRLSGEKLRKKVPLQSGMICQDVSSVGNLKEVMDMGWG